MLLGLVSAKGSPGVTTAALALTAACSGALVELDPSGGSVACWTGATGEPGLIPVASGLRRAIEADLLLSYSVMAPGGVRSLLAPTSGALAESTIAAMGERFLPVLAELDTTLVIDAGRWALSQSTTRRIAGCDVVGVVCAPTVAGVEAARWIVEPLTSITAKVMVVLVGDRPYQSSEVAAAVGAPVAGVLDWDPRGLSALLASGTGRGWSRSGLARSARSTFASLTSRSTDSVSGAAGG